MDLNGGGDVMVVVLEEKKSLGHCIEIKRDGEYLAEARGSALGQHDLGRHSHRSLTIHGTWGDTI